LRALPEELRAELRDALTLLKTLVGLRTALAAGGLVAILAGIHVAAGPNAGWVLMIVIGTSCNGLIGYNARQAVASRKRFFFYPKLWRFHSSSLATWTARVAV